MPALEDETGLLDGVVHLLICGSAGDGEGFGPEVDFGGGHAFDAEGGFFDGGLAMVAMHALDTINTGAADGFLFFETAEKFHS